MHNFKIVFFINVLFLLNISHTKYLHIISQEIKKYIFKLFMFNEYYCFVYNILHKLSIAYKYLFSEINLHFVEN